MFNWFLWDAIKEKLFVITPLRDMECLHGKPVSCSKTTNGVFFYCGQKPSWKPGRSLKVVMKIVNRLTKSTCQSLKTKKTREA